MSKKIAIKKLTSSDLTFFEYHFRNHRAGNQKAINLNADVFITKMYPILDNFAEKHRNRIPISLEIYGPGIEYGVYPLMRKIIKGENYKNWRLNGEFIYTPDNEPERFQLLSHDDFAIMEFDGDENCPDLCKIFLVASNNSYDIDLHQKITTIMGGKSMITISQIELEEIVNELSPPINLKHPILDIILNSFIEDAAFGGIKGIKKLRDRPSFSRVNSQETLDQARAKATKTGNLGEEIINQYLTKEKKQQRISNFEWSSRENAVAPYDFKIETISHDNILIDVKSTEYDFSNTLHISFNELLMMREEEFCYHIYRIYNVNDSKALLRISENLHEFAVTIYDVFRNLPSGVTPDSISIDPNSINFGEEIIIEYKN